MGGVILGVSVAPGMILWWPTRHKKASRADFGVNLVTGAVVALAIFVLQILFEQRLDRVDQQRQVQADRQNLELTIGLQKNLTGIRLPDKPLSGFYLYDKTLRDADLSGADLSGATLTKSDLSCANLAGTILSEVNATDVVLEGANFRKAVLDGAAMSYSHRGRYPCDEPHPYFDNAVLTNAVLDHARLPETSFKDANLENADLSYAVLSGSDFTSARLVNADFEYADLKGAAFTGADLHRANFRDAVYDSATQWPKHFKYRRCPASRGQCRFA